MVNVVLLTARSACAAWGMLEIWRYASLDANLSITVAAQEPALTILKNHDVPVLAVNLLPAEKPSDPSSEKILAHTQKLLSRISPNVALVGLSTPGEGGIDEAVLALAECPTFMLQDFWGDSNLFFAKHPDCYLVADQEAALATKRRHNKQAIILGSPRHAKYAQLDFDLLRERTLIQLGLGVEAIVLGLFCQPIFFQGYLDTIQAWAEAVRSVKHDKIIYRPHPASSSTQVVQVQKILSENNLDFVTIAGGAVEPVIAVCTSLSTVMSNSNVDAVYVNHFASCPMVSPIYLLFNDDVVVFMRGFHNVDSIPTVTQDLALLVREESHLLSVLKQSIDQAVRHKLWFNAREISNPVAAVYKAKDIMVNPEKWVELGV